jgi:hypothetical protein
LIQKAKTEEPKTELQQHQTGLTGGSERSDRCATTQSRIFESEDTRLDRNSCVEAKQVAIAGIRLMEKASSLPKPPLRGLYP